LSLPFALVNRPLAALSTKDPDRLCGFDSRSDVPRVCFAALSRVLPSRLKRPGRFHPLSELVECLARVE
jgi:hypothetical protein